MIKYIILTLCIGQLHAEELTMKKYIQKSLEVDKKYEQFKLDLERKNYIIDQGLPANALTFSLEHEVGKVSDSDTDNISTVGSLSKEFSLTGTKINFQQSHTERPNIDANTTEISIEQSLIRNSFGRDTRLLKSQLNEQANLVQNETDEEMETYYLEALTLYFEYQAAYSNYQLALQIKKDTDRLTEQVKKRFEKQVATKTDRDKALIEQVDADSDLLAKERDLELIKTRMIEKIGKIDKSFSPESVKTLYNMFRSLSVSELSIYKTRNYKISELNEKISQMQIDLFERQQNIDLALIAGHATEDSTRYSAPVKQDETLIGVKLTVPFGDDQAQANAQLARLDYRKNKLEKERLEKQLEQELINIKTQIKFFEKNLVLLQKKVELSKSILKDEEKRYLIGRIDLDSLLERKSEYTRNQFAYQESLTTYFILSTQWMEFNDQLNSFVTKLF